MDDLEDITERISEQLEAHGFGSGDVQDAIDIISPALDSLLDELRRVKEDNEYLQGKWNAAEDRCPQCGTGVKASPYVISLREENERLQQLYAAAYNRDEQDRLREIEKAAREALERIANAPASLDEGRIMRTIALNALQPQTESGEEAK